VLAALVLANHVWLRGRGATTLRVAAVASLLVLVTALDPATLPRVRVDPVGKGESLLEAWEGAAGVVAVVRRRDGALKIKVNNFYTLGDTGAIGRVLEQRQAHLPLLIHPDPRRVFFLGLGTGVTAGASLDHDSVERVTVAEIVPEVITASRTHFGKHTNGLFDDERVSVLAEDGRNFLAATNETFDVIVADLFVPWKAGTGNLYTVEHYEAAKSRLNEFGIYAQWLPLYQLSQREFLTIAHTMYEVFPMVTVWRGDFLAEQPIMLLVGYRDPAPLMKPSVLPRLPRPGGGYGPLATLDPVTAAPDRQLGPLMLFYAGNLTGAGDLVTASPLNTDDLPLIEYRAPLAHREARADVEPMFIGEPMLDFYGRLLEAYPPDRDAHLALLNESERDHVRAGLHLHRAELIDQRSDDRGAYWRERKRAEALMR